MIALFAALVLGLSVSPGTALAGVSGQQDVWGEFGEGPGQFFDPFSMAADSADGSVFVASFNGTSFSETVIQKFSAAGTFEASVSLPGLNYGPIAVDGPNERLYVIETGEENGHRTAASILAFSTKPTGTTLVPAEKTPLPVPTGPSTLIQPRELVVDPSTGDLVILAQTQFEPPVLQRIKIAADGSGTVGPKWVDSGNVLQPLKPPALASVAIDAKGITYVISSDNGSGNISAVTLPANFTGASIPTAVPGFASAVDPGESMARGGEFNSGPQIAVWTSANGEDTIYWKSLGGAFGNVLVEGYSPDAEARTVVFGGGTEQGHCLIPTEEADIAAGSDGSIVVLNQGSEVELPGQEPSVFPLAYHFGPGGDECPAPAPAFSPESGGHPVTSVPAGSTVTFNGAATELKGASLEQTEWQIVGPAGSGSQKVTETVMGTSNTFSHKFTAEGSYTVRMVIKAHTSQFAPTFSTAETLQVTAGGGTPEFSLNLTKTGTGTGGFECTVDGGTAGPCLTEYPEGESVAVTPKPAGGSKFVEWTGDCTGTGACSVTMSAAHTITAVFNTESAPPATEFSLTVSPTAGGSVTCNSGSCAPKYVKGTSVVLTAVPASGFEFVEWTGDCAGRGGCTLTMNGARSVGAKFQAVPPTNNPPSNNPPSGSTPPSGNPPSTGTPPPGGGRPSKTKKQAEAEKRQKAIKQCKKLSGKAEAKCLAKARQIGKTKPKAKPKPKAKK